MESDRAKRIVEKKDPAESTNDFTDQPNFYKPTQKKQILASFKHNPESDIDILLRINDAAEGYRLWRAKPRRADDYSRRYRKKHWSKIAALTKKLHDALIDSQHMGLLEDLQNGPEKLSVIQIDDRPPMNLPDLSRGTEGYELMRTAKRQFEDTHRIATLPGELAWLYRSIDQFLSKEPGSDQPRKYLDVPGRRSDDALNGLIADLKLVYRDYALEPRQPKSIDEIGDAKGGEPINFLQACLLPLDIQLTNEALSSRWFRL